MDWEYYTFDNPPTPQHLEELIVEAFDGVSLEGGISWREAEAIDNYEIGETRQQARERNTDHCWQDVLDDSTRNFASMTVFSFGDFLGFRFYLAPLLIRSVREGTPPSTLTFHRWLSDPNQFSVKQRVALARFMMWAAVVDITPLHFHTGEWYVLLDEDWMPYVNPT